MNPQLDKIFIPLSVAATVTLILLIARVVVFKVLNRWASKTETKLDDAIIRSLRLPSLFWCVAIGLFVAVDASDMPKQYSIYVTRGIHVLIIVSVTVVVSHLAEQFLDDIIRHTGVPIPSTRLAFGVIKSTIAMIGFLIVLSVMGISIAPLLTAFGVGGLAVALALQDTLANFFSGVHVLMERSIRVGDFVKLESGQEGYVADITWRTTRIRMLPNNMVIIPNSKLAQSVVTNYHLPEPRMSVMIPVGVSYGSDPAHVEKVLVEEAKAAQAEMPEMLKDAEPFVRFIPGFGDSSLDFTLICQVREFADQYLVQHELRKRIFRRFQAEGIEIPFPHRTVYLKGDTTCQSGA